MVALDWKTGDHYRQWQGTRQTCTQFHGNPCSNCWVVVRPTDTAIPTRKFNVELQQEMLNRIKTTSSPASCCGGAEGMAEVSDFIFPQLLFYTSKFTFKRIKKKSHTIQTHVKKYWTYKYLTVSDTDLDKDSSTLIQSEYVYQNQFMTLYFYYFDALIVIKFTHLHTHKLIFTHKLEQLRSLHIFPLLASSHRACWYEQVDYVLTT